MMDQNLVLTRAVFIKDEETIKAHSIYRERMTKSERDCAQIMDDFDRARARVFVVRQDEETT